MTFLSPKTSWTLHLSTSICWSNRKQAVHKLKRIIVLLLVVESKKTMKSSRLCCKSQHSYRLTDVLASVFAKGTCWSILFKMNPILSSISTMSFTTDLLENRVLKQRQRRRQREGHKFAYLVVKNKSFARPTRAFFTFVHFFAVVSKTT